MKVLLFSRYGSLGASSRVRSLQYVPYFKSQGVEVTIRPLFSDAYLRALYGGGSRWRAVLKGYISRVYWLFLARKFDVVIIEKELFPFLPALAERFLRLSKVPYVVDYDDALFHRYDCHNNPVIRLMLGKKIDAVMRLATTVIAGNNYLAERARRAGAERVEIVPTVVDTDRYHPSAGKASEVPIVGWIGTPQTSRYLNPLLPVFEALQSEMPVRFVAVGANPEDFEGTRVEVWPWSEDSEVDSVQRFDIGIMPLEDSHWERGKCGYKLIQYMACGLPVVASPVGVNCEIVEQGKSGMLAGSQCEWEQSLRELIKADAGTRKRMGMVGQERVSEWYSTRVQAPRIFKTLFDAAHSKAEKHKRLLIVVNSTEFFISHRLPIAKAAKANGYDVHVISADAVGVEIIRANGLIHHAVDFARSGQNPFVELRTLFQLTLLFKRLAPDLVHLVTIKPVLYGGIAARLTGVPGVVSAISGLGTVFVADSAFARLRKWMITRLYRAAFRQKSLAVIFQNPDDRETLLCAGTMSKHQVHMIRGSGVQLSEYPYVDEPEGKPVAVMASRLLKDKGGFEFVDAARILTERGVDVEMRLIGSADPGNPTSVTQKELSEWTEEGIVKLLGHRDDVAEQYASANIVCLPSFYGEGLPKSLVEAASVGRAVITTDHPGCRDAIEPDVSGILVPPQNAESLADAIEKLIDDPALRQQMGRAGRVLAEREYAIEKIVDQHLRIYREVLEHA